MMRISSPGLKYAWGIRSVSQSIEISSKGMSFRAKLGVRSVSHSVEIYGSGKQFGFQTKGTFGEASHRDRTHFIKHSMAKNFLPDDYFTAPFHGLFRALRFIPCMLNHPFCRPLSL